MLLILGALAVIADTVRARVWVFGSNREETVVSADFVHELSPTTLLTDHATITFSVSPFLINQATKELVIVKGKVTSTCISYQSLIETSEKQALNLYQRPFG